MRIYLLLALCLSACASVEKDGVTNLGCHGEAREIYQPYGVGGGSFVEVPKSCNYKETKSVSEGSVIGYECPKVAFSNDMLGLSIRITQDPETMEELSVIRDDSVEETFRASRGDRIGIILEVMNNSRRFLYFDSPIRGRVVCSRNATIREFCRVLKFNSGEGYSRSGEVDVIAPMQTAVYKGLFTYKDLFGAKIFERDELDFHGGRYLVVGNGGKFITGSLEVLLAPTRGVDEISPRMKLGERSSQDINLLYRGCAVRDWISDRHSINFFTN